MSTTDAVREVMTERRDLGLPPISLMELQGVLRARYGIVALDSSISRRLREQGAKSRVREGTARCYEYWLERPAVQQTILAIGQQHWHEDLL